jgi:hypothetical protein
MSGLRLGVCFRFIFVSALLGSSLFAAGCGGESAKGDDTFGGPPSEPPEAAAHITVTPNPSGTLCNINVAHGLLTIPNDPSVYDNLNCDLADGCAPDLVTAVNRIPDPQISCTVARTGSAYNISAFLKFPPGDTLTVSGQIAGEGGLALMTHRFSGSGVTLNGQCTLTIEPNRGAIGPGRIWAHFTCPNFTDPSAPGGTDCAAEGAFLFDHCEGG